MVVHTAGSSRVVAADKELGTDVLSMAVERDTASLLVGAVQTRFLLVVERSGYMAEGRLDNSLCLYMQIKLLLVVILGLLGCYSSHLSDPIACKFEFKLSLDDCSVVECSQPS